MTHTETTRLSSEEPDADGVATCCRLLSTRANFSFIELTSTWMSENAKKRTVFCLIASSFTSNCSRNEPNSFLYTSSFSME